MTRLPLNAASTLAIAAIAFSVGCGGDSTSPGGGTVKDYITAVQAVVQPAASLAAPNRSSIGRITIKRHSKSSAARGSFNSDATPSITAVFHTGTPPTGGGPTVDGEAESTPLYGQPFRFGVTGSADFSTVYISVGGVDGYWQVDLGSAARAVELVLALAANPPSADFSLRTAVGASGSAGASTTTSLSAVDLADADIAVTLKWTGASDVDLHVVDPKGQEIFWEDRTTPEGGQLNLDSNPACDIDNVNQETISWPKDKAPHGSYSVSVHYFSDCGQPNAPFSVTINEKGQFLESLGASFTGTSDDSQKLDITTFTFP
jgi:hypothetical protein